MSRLRTAISHSKIDLDHPQYYLNREISWLEFNRRVLHEAMDSRTPLLERLKFTAIFSSNLDEFFMVRVALLKERLEAYDDRADANYATLRNQLIAISQHLRPAVAEQHRHFERSLRPLLASHGIYLLNYIDLNQEQRLYLDDYFEQHIFPVLTPLAVDPAHPFPHISNLSLNLAVTVLDPITGEEHFARVKVPHLLPRLVAFPAHLHYDGNAPAVWTGVPLEQVIAHNLEMLFPGMNIQEYSLFRITRDSDLELDEDGNDLLQTIEEELRKRRLGGSAVRMEIQAAAPLPVRETLMREMNLTEHDVYTVDGLINLRDLMPLLALPLPQLKDAPWTPTVPARLQHLGEGNHLKPPKDGENIFTVIQRGDVLVHHPYDSFAATVERFVTEAAHDPQVLAIKMTLYRTSGDSPIVSSLIDAAENGKQVSVLVELKARFDEENNINWARKLEQAGVHVVYGLVGLKTHTKVVLVVRQEAPTSGTEDIHIRRYVHIGTGNYNPKTARLYTDLGLLSCRDDLGADLSDLFNYLTGYSRQQSYRKLLVAPVNLRDRLIDFIRQETGHCLEGRSGRIIAKMNALVDPALIHALYEASQAGVQIDLIVRGMCCLRPGVKGVSDNIRVISIVGRYLEHSRIFYFYNGGQEQVFIGSADWMPRNLDRRVEAVTPVEDGEAIKELQTILGILLADNRHAWELQPNGTYVQRQPLAGGTDQCAQTALMELARQFN